MEIDPATLTEARRYGLLIGAIVPRPIAVVGTVDRAGRSNLAPFSFFNGISSEPFLVMFCPANREDGGEKDTLANAKSEAEGGTGCFSIGLATERTVRRVVACSERLPHGESEFALSGLTPAACVRIRAPRFAESPVTFECETVEVKRFAPGVPDGGNLIIGRVVYLHVDDGVLDERARIDPARLEAVGRMGGASYCTTRDRLEIPRGRAALGG
ncbi:MAG: flavin reductase family protein [Planctomycetaceae bacterium]|nr:flavin reductase family protein [Planctomycetaceae bacterium]